MVKWKGFADKDNTWEPIHNLTAVLYMIDAFEAKRKRQEDDSAVDVADLRKSKESDDSDGETKKRGRGRPPKGK